MMAIRSAYELAELYCTETEKQFARKLYEILLQTGLPPRRLELEITETALVRDLDRALVTLRQIKALGVRVAMVDFGTGYSSSRICRYFRSTRLQSTPHSSNLSIATTDRCNFRAVLAWGKAFACPSLPKGSDGRRTQIPWVRTLWRRPRLRFWPTRPIEDFSDLVHGIGHAPTVSGHAETNCLIQS